MSTGSRRLQRVRVLDALERRAKQFRTRQELWPLRVPREPLPLDEVIAEALPEDHHAFDAAALRSRTLLHLGWDDGSVWELWVIMLPSRLRLFCDHGDEETRVLASGGRHAGDETDRLFLELLAASAGQHFGIEMSGGAPSHVRSAIRDRDFLVDVFVDLFEGTEMEDSISGESVVRQPDAASELASHGTDFRADVEHWLGRALQHGRSVPAARLETPE